MVVCVSLLDGAVEAGARVEVGGAAEGDDNYLDPTVLSHVPADAAVMQEEIFGPLLPIVPFDTLDEALAAVNSRPKPLALYVFGGDRANVERVLAETSAGGACVNEVAVHFLHANLPFGGINHSGHGSAHGFFGFQAFSHAQGVLRHHRFSALKLMAPPYGPRAKRLIAWTLKFF